MPDTPKTWWAPVWRGLVVDPTGKHYRRMRGAVWLYLYLLLHANRSTGTLVCKLPTVSRMTGIPGRTLQRFLNRLRREGYVWVAETGRALRIGIRRWKPLRGASKVAPLPRQIWRPSHARNVAEGWSERTKKA